MYTALRDENESGGEIKRLQRSYMDGSSWTASSEAMEASPAAVLGSHIKYRRKVVGQGEKVDDEMDGAKRFVRLSPSNNTTE